MEWPTILESLNRSTSDNAMNSDVGNNDPRDFISSEAKHFLDAGDQEMSDNPIDAELAGRVSTECGGGGLCLFNSLLASYHEQHGNYPIFAEAGDSKDRALAFRTQVLQHGLGRCNLQDAGEAMTPVKLCGACKVSMVIIGTGLVILKLVGARMCLADVFGVLRMTFALRSVINSLVHMEISTSRITDISISQQ